MGALHNGHLSLIRQAAQLDRGPVVATIFVNPTQFGPDDDFDKYPRTLQTDTKAAFDAGAVAVFAPEVEHLYPDGVDAMYTPVIPKVATAPALEDAHRPGHFAGVCQVVRRFFELLQPTAALFGQKDYQQLLTIRAMTKAENLPIDIIGATTLREADGLAMSSRNRYLSSTERSQATALYQALHQLQKHGFDSIADGESQMSSILDTAQVQIEYAVIRDGLTLLSPSAETTSLRALIAARVGSTRLIDNVAIDHEILCRRA